MGTNNTDANGSHAPAGTAWPVATTAPGPTLGAPAVVTRTLVAGHTRVLAMARPSPALGAPAAAPPAPMSEAEQLAALRAVEAGLESASALVIASGRRLEPVRTALVRAVLHRWRDSPDHAPAPAGTGTDLVIAVVGRGGGVVTAFGDWSGAVVTDSEVMWLPEWTWEDPSDPSVEGPGDHDSDPPEPLDPRGLDHPNAARFAEVMWVPPGKRPRGVWLAPAGALDDVAGPTTDPEALLSEVTGALRQNAFDPAPDGTEVADDLDAAHSEPPPLPPQTAGRLRLTAPILAAWAGEAQPASDSPGRRGALASRLAARRSEPSTRARSRSRPTVVIQGPVAPLPQALSEPGTDSPKASQTTASAQPDTPAWALTVDTVASAPTFDTPAAALTMDTPAAPTVDTPAADTLASAPTVDTPAAAPTVDSGPAPTPPTPSAPLYSPSSRPLPLPLMSDRTPSPSGAPPSRTATPRPPTDSARAPADAWSVPVAPPPSPTDAQASDRQADSARPAVSPKPRRRPTPRARSRGSSTREARGIRAPQLVLLAAVILAILAVPAWALTRPSPAPPTDPTPLVLPSATSTAAKPSPTPTTPASSSPPSPTPTPTPTSNPDTATPTRAVVPPPTQSAAPAPVPTQTPTPPPVETTPAPSPPSTSPPPSPSASDSTSPPAPTGSATP